MPQQKGLPAASIWSSVQPGAKNARPVDALNGQIPPATVSAAPTGRKPGWLPGSWTAPGSLPAAASSAIPFAWAWFTAAVNSSTWSGVGGILDDNGMTIAAT